MSRSYYIKFDRQIPLTTKEQSKLLSIIDDYDFPVDSLKGELCFWRKPTVDCYPEKILKKFNDPNLVIYFVPKEEFDDFVYGDEEKYKYTLVNKKLQRTLKFNSKVEKLITNKCFLYSLKPFTSFSDVEQNLIWLSNSDLDVAVYYYTDKYKKKTYKLSVKTQFWSIGRVELCYDLKELLDQLDRILQTLKTI